MQTSNNSAFKPLCAEAIPKESCPYYPCHAGIPDDDFSCEYCFCPLYQVPYCGGNFSILPNGIKDCSKCTRPHTRSGRAYIATQIRLRNSIKTDKGDNQ